MLEVLDPRQSCHECLSKVREGRGADDHQQGNAMSYNGVAFVRLVSDASIVGQRSPAAPPYLLQPLIVGGVVPKVVRVSFNRQTA
jgi:hypothetical protein